MSTEAAAVTQDVPGNISGILLEQAVQRATGGNWATNSLSSETFDTRAHTACFPAGPVSA